MKIRIDDSHLYTVLTKLNSCVDSVSDAKIKCQNFFGLISFDAYSANRDFNNAKAKIRNLSSELNNLRNDLVDYRNEIDNIVFDTPELTRGENEKRRDYNARKRENDNTEEQIASGELVRLHDGTVVDPDAQSIVQLSDGNYALKVDCVPLNGVYELKENCYQLYDDSYALKEDCTMVYEGCYVISPEPLPEIEEDRTPEDYQRYASDWMNIYGDLADKNGTTISEEFWKDKADDWGSPVKYSDISNNGNMDIVATDGYSAGRQFGASRSGGRVHAALDIDIGPGDTVVAMADGEVIDVTRVTGWGDFISVRNDDGTIIRYCELESNLEIGDTVEKGITKIGDNNIVEGWGGSDNVLHIEVYAGTEKETTDFVDRTSSGATGYDYIENANYQRRNDLLDPSGVKKIVTDNK